MAELGSLARVRAGERKGGGGNRSVEALRLGFCGGWRSDIGERKGDTDKGREGRSVCGRVAAAGEALALG